MMEDGIFDSLLHNGATLHFRKHLLRGSDGVGCDAWGNFWATPSDSAMPTGMRLIHQTLDNFQWSGCTPSDCARTFGPGEGASLNPASYLEGLFRGDKALRPEKKYAHGGYLRVNGTRSGDLALLRKWVYRADRHAHGHACEHAFGVCHRSSRLVEMLSKERPRVYIHALDRSSALPMELHIGAVSSGLQHDSDEALFPQDSWVRSGLESGEPLKEEVCCPVCCGLQARQLEAPCHAVCRACRTCAAGLHPPRHRATRA